MNRKLSTLLGFGAGLAASLGGNQKQWKQIKRRVKKAIK
ncbi:DUF3918 domain-containing protein [Bacillus sp. 2205SS5-2]